jgi:FkbM family methyltransferase
MSVTLGTRFGHDEPMEAMRRVRGGLLRALRAPDPKIGMDVALAGLSGRGFAPLSVLDVGAAAGTWTRLALMHWPQARYLLIEPLHERRAELAATAAQWPNASYLIASAGSVAGRQKLNVSADLWGSSFLYEGVDAREVEVVTVDDLVASGELRAPDLMKLDVQGYELEVLAGAADTIERCEVIILEVRLFRGRPGMPMLHEAIDWMVQHGFRPYEIADVLRRPLDGAMAQCDVVFVREGSELLRVEGWA